MKIDLCKIFGVEEGEEFKIDNFPFKTNRYKVCEGVLKFKTKYDDIWRVSDLVFNSIVDCEVVKPPKKKEFTDDELCILRNIDKKYKWIARDKNGDLTIFAEKPCKLAEIWDFVAGSAYSEIYYYNHLFNSITWEDEETVFIDDYVERN